MALDGFGGIVRAGGIETAVIAQPGAEQMLVERNHGEQWAFHQGRVSRLVGLSQLHRIGSARFQKLLTIGHWRISRPPGCWELKAVGGSVHATETVRIALQLPVGMRTIERILVEFVGLP